MKICIKLLNRYFWNFYREELFYFTSNYMIFFFHYTFLAKCLKFSGIPHSTEPESSNPYIFMNAFI